MKLKDEITETYKSYSMHNNWRFLLKMAKIFFFFSFVCNYLELNH